ncbi:glycoside hydrolase domain-containing protein, partial [Streptomyces sp. SYSU K217416]
MPKHRLSRKNRYIALAATGVIVVAGAGVAAQTSMAAPAWPAQKTYTGRAFDACTAPSLTAMKAWKSDAYYGGVAVYVGGKNRGCAQPNLTQSWVKSVDTLGWRVIPLYVGAQPPCQKSGNKERFTAATAASVGVSNANDAIVKA